MITKPDTNLKQQQDAIARDIERIARRATFTDFDGVADNMAQSIDDMIDKHPDTVRNDKGVQTSPHFLTTHGESLDRMAGTLEYIAETLERGREAEEIKARTSEEWREMERTYYWKTSQFNAQDLTKADDPAEYRECGHRFCIDIFKPEKKLQKYCSNECRRQEALAVREYKRTEKSPDYDNPTYLPVYAYKTKRGDYGELQYKTNEIAVEAETFETLKAVADATSGDKTPEGNTSRQTPQAPQDGVTAFNVYNMPYHKAKESGLLGSITGAACTLNNSYVNM